MPDNKNNKLNITNNVVYKEKAHHRFFDTEDLLTYTGNYLDDHDLMNFSLVNRGIFKTLKTGLYKRAGKKLWRSVLRNDIKSTKKILTIYPKLFFTESKKIFTPLELKSGIECDYRKIRFDISDETPLTFTLKQYQVDLLSEFTVIAINAAAVNVLLKDDFDEIRSQWRLAEQKLKVISEKNLDDTFLVLFGRIKRELHKDFYPYHPIPESFHPMIPLNTLLQRFREDHLEVFKQIRLDNYYDIMSLIISSLKIYEKDNYYHYFGKFDLKVAPLYMVKILGYLQSLLNPAVAEIFCSGGTNFRFSKKDTAPIILGSISEFYRKDIAKNRGLGLNFYLDIKDGKIIDLKFRAKCYRNHSSDYENLKDYFEIKLELLSSLINEHYEKLFANRAPITTHL